MGSRLTLPNSEMSSESVTPRAEVLNSGGSSSYIWPTRHTPQPLDSSSTSLAEEEGTGINPYLLYRGIVPTQEAIEKNHAAFMRFNEEEAEQVQRERDAYEKGQLVLQIGNKVRVKKTKIILVERIEL
jgi:hypothetical protein